MNNEVEVSLVDHPRYAEAIRNGDYDPMLAVQALREVLRHYERGCFTVWVFKNNTRKDFED